MVDRKNAEESCIEAEYYDTNKNKMVKQLVTIRNRAGLHTRPAASIVKTAAKYKSDFYIEKDGIEINGKSIIGVMTLAAEQGATLTLRFEGVDEKDAAKEMVALFESGFGEPM